MFGEKFGFCVEERHSFLNVCVMCRQAARQDKQRKLVVPEKHLVLAHVRGMWLRTDVWGASGQCWAEADLSDIS